MDTINNGFEEFDTEPSAVNQIDIHELESTMDTATPVLYTAQYRFKGVGRLDITSNGLKNPATKHFCPSWDITGPYLDGKTSRREFHEQYIQMLIELVETHPEKWAELRSWPIIVPVCYCGKVKTETEGCQRVLFARFAEQVLGIKYVAELALPPPNLEIVKRNSPLFNLVNFPRPPIHHTF